MRIGIDCRKVADFGIGTYIRGLTHALAELEGDEEYVLFAPAEHRHLLPAGPRFRWVEESAPNYSMRELFALGRHEVDLFHATHYVVPLGRTPVVVTIHDLIHLTQRRAVAAERLYASTMIRRAVRKSAAIATVSETIARQICARYPEAVGKIFVTPNGVDERFSPAGVTPRPTAFLFVGNEKPHKNLLTLLEAFRAVRREEPGLTLVLAGGAQSREEGVISRGYVSDQELVQLYRSAIALVLPSIEEGFGLPVAEAMACGTPVIASDAEALVEVAGGAAHHVPWRDSSALAEAMLRVARDEELRGKMRSDGLARAANFSWRECAERTLRIYRGVWNVVERKK